MKKSGKYILKGFLGAACFFGGLVGVHAFAGWLAVVMGA